MSRAATTSSGRRAAAERHPPRPATRRGQRDSELERLSLAFRGVTAALRRLQGREGHRPGELSFAQYKLLFELAHGGAMTAGELARAAVLSGASVTQMLDNLARSGLVERVRGAEDRRVVVTRLTAAGERAVEARRAVYEPLWKSALSGFDASELAIAADVLEKLRGLFDDLATSEPPAAESAASPSDGSARARTAISAR